MTDARLIRAYVGSLGLLAFAGAWAAVADRPSSPVASDPSAGAAVSSIERRERALLGALARMEAVPGPAARIVADPPVTSTGSS